MLRWIGRELWARLRPYASRSEPVAPWVRILHRIAVTLAGPGPDKGRLPARWHPGEYYDANLAQELVALGIIPTTILTVDPAKYAGLLWSVTFSQNRLSQGEGSTADLIWVLTMPPERASTPILFFHEPHETGPQILDGSHRLIRAIVDGASSIDVQLIGQTDVYRFRKRA